MSFNRAEGFRYYKTATMFNDSPTFNEHLDARNKYGIRHFVTPKFRRLNYHKLAGLSVVSHTWTFGDRFYKLAHKYYENSTLWWIIAYANQKPTDSHCTLGDTIKIYMPLREVLIQLGMY